MNVEKSGSDDQAGRVKDRQIGNAPVTDRVDHSIANDNIGNSIDIQRGIHHPPILHEQIHYPPSSR